MTLIRALDADIRCSVEFSHFMGEYSTVARAHFTRVGVAIMTLEF